MERKGSYINSLFGKRDLYDEVYQITLYNHKKFRWVSRSKSLEVRYETRR